MKRNNLLHIILEMLVILGFLVIGISILTYLFQGVPMDRLFLGAMILSIGIISFTDFFTWRYATKTKGIQSEVVSFLTIALGAVLLIFPLESKLICILMGAFFILSAVTTIVTAALNLTSQPLLNGIKIVVSIVQIVFSIFLIVRTLDYLSTYMMFLGISLVALAFVLLIEFMIRRYQSYQN